jgi:hypothetical protein
MLNYAQKRVIAALLCLVVVLVWFDRKSSPNPSQATQAQNEKKGGNKNNQKPEWGEFWNWLTKDTTGFFSSLLVIIAGGQLALFYVQLRLIGESLVDARKAAKSAEDAANAALENASATKILAEATKAAMLPSVSFTGVNLTQRKFDPKIFTTTGHGTAVRITDAIPPEISDATIGLKNLGQTSAIITSLCAEYLVSDTLIDTPTYTHRVFPNYNVGMNQEAFLVAATNPVRLTPAQRKEIEDKTAKLWVYGIVAYRDVMRDEWELGFVACWQIREGEHSGFDWAHDPRYVFSRKKVT